MELSYISGNGNPKKFLIFQETELSDISGSSILSSKNKNSHSEKTSYVSGNGTL